MSTLPASHAIPRFEEKTCVTFEGLIYNPNDSVWRFEHAGEVITFQFDELDISTRLAKSHKQVIGSLLARRKLSTAHRYHITLRNLLRRCSRQKSGTVEIALTDLSEIFDWSTSRPIDGDRTVLFALKHWVQLGYPGLTTEAAEFIRIRTLPPQTQATSVKLLCSKKGAYSELEFSGIQSSLHAAYAAGKVDIYDYALTILSLTIAPRPAQICRLQIKHLISTPRSDGSLSYILKIPRLKQRQAVETLRARKLLDAVGLVLHAIADEGRALARHAGVAEDDVPLFWSINPRTALYVGPRIPVQVSARLISHRIKLVLQELKVRSERTGANIKGNPSRSRKTLGTRAAAEGKGALVIADLLDHSDATSAKPYIEARPEMLKRIDKAVALQLAPLAQRFAGKLARRDIGAMYLKHVYGGVKGECPDDIGGCGKHAFCGLVAPLACYTCIHFRPWLDAPHEAILAELINKRNDAMDESSMRVASSLDETIFAVAEVVQKISAMRG